MSGEPNKLQEVEIVTKRQQFNGSDNQDNGQNIQTVYSNQKNGNSKNSQGPLTSGNKNEDPESQNGIHILKGDGTEKSQHTNDGQAKSQVLKNNRYQRFKNDQEAEANAKAELEQEKKSIFDDDEIKSPYPKLEAILENNYFQIFVTLITVYALFGDDCRVLTTTKSADIYFDIVTIIAMVTFLLEMLLAMLSKISYTCSFYFWLDLISTISLLLDIQLFTQEVFYSGNSNANQLAQAGKASRVGTKTGRIVRLVRLIRIVKLYKATQDAKEKRQNMAKQKFAEKKRKKKQRIHPNEKLEDEKKVEEKKSFCPCLSKQKKKKTDKFGNSANGGAQKQSQVVYRDPQTRKLSMKPGKSLPTVVNIQKKKEEIQNQKKEAQRESRVSQVLSARTTKRVIIIVLTLLLIMPFFSASYFYDSPAQIDFAMYFMKQWSEEAGTTEAQLKLIFDDIIKVNKYQEEQMYIAYIKTPFPNLSYQAENYDELRQDEKQQGVYKLSIDDYKQTHPTETALIAHFESLKQDDLNFNGIMSIRRINTFTAALSLGRTVFVCFVLTCGALYFSKDANDLALGPIERMIVKLTRISRNPISAREEVQIQDDAEENETKLIENAIVKISNLLALGFGEAGSKIIGTNISQQGGDVDPMLPGHKLWAIYGFCNIRNFVYTTEIMQEDIMIFVNNIGEIVHSYTDRYQGAANKNIGDSFLLVWRIQEDRYQMVDQEVQYKDQKYISILCDMAVICFMRIQSKINREPKILSYKDNTKLNEKMPNYKVQMGFGLHLGWGIEGAIGSEFKIDASYLSPNVNLATRLEGTTKLYGVPIIISSVIQDQCTPQLKRYTRFIDRVQFLGCQTPLGLYTIDMEVENLPISKNSEEFYTDVEERKDFLNQKKLELSNQLHYWEGEVDEDYEPWNAEEQITIRKDLKLMMENWDEKFQNLFAEGFQMYIRGNWKAAKSKFSYILRCEEYSKDGPTKKLLNFMEETDYNTPPNWSGYRQLNDY